MYSSSPPLSYFYQYDSEYRSGIRDWSFRTDFDYTPIPSHHIKFGVEYLYHTFRPETNTSKMKEEENGVTEQDVYKRQGTNCAVFRTLNTKNLILPLPQVR